MNKLTRIQLANLTKTTNIIKYTLGLPLLSGVSFIFIFRIIGTLILLYINISLYPENIKENLEYLDRLKKGLNLLWAPNKIKFE